MKRIGQYDFIFLSILEHTYEAINSLFWLIKNLIPMKSYNAAKHNLFLSYLNKSIIIHF